MGKGDFLKRLEGWLQHCKVKVTACSLIIFIINRILKSIRMKSDLKTYKFNFKATIGDFVLNAPNISCPLVANWKRSSQSATSEPAQMKGGKATFNQTLTLPVNMYYNIKNEQFESKKTLFTFTMNTPKGDKQAGVVYVEVASMLNNKLEKIEDNYKLEKCPVKESTVFISIEAELLEQGSMSDTMSVDSTILNQSAGPSTLSTMSIQSKKQVEQSASQTFKKSQDKSKSSGNDQKDKKISQLQKQVSDLTQQKDKLLKQLQKSRNRDDNKQLSNLKDELIKSKGIQEKLETEIGNLRAENVEHERQLEKMRIRMQQIYDLLLGNLNSLY